MLILYFEQTGYRSKPCIGVAGESFRWTIYQHDDHCFERDFSEKELLFTFDPVGLKLSEIEKRVNRQNAISLPGRTIYDPLSNAIDFEDKQEVVQVLSAIMAAPKSNLEERLKVSRRLFKAQSTWIDSQKERFDPLDRQATFEAGLLFANYADKQPLGDHSAYWWDLYVTCKWINLPDFNESSLRSGVDVRPRLYLLRAKRRVAAAYYLLSECQPS